jgi:glycerol-1-phosphate dehydrogenase [NAD(P)+]
MTLRFDPADIEAFKASLCHIPGYPDGEILPIRQMLFEAGALFRVPEMLALAGANPIQPLLVVMDRTPMRRGPDDLKQLLLQYLAAAGWQPQPVWLEPDERGQVHTDWTHIKSVQDVLLPGTAVVSVGSGTVSDIAKHACHVVDSQSGGPATPLVCVATANSVSAYTSNMAPVFVNGVKRTLASRYPDVLVCDLETLRDAPRDMTAAGVGDLLAAFNSYADWYLAYCLGLDPSYTTFAQTLMGDLNLIILENASAIREGTLGGVAILAKLIALGGLAMSLSHATAPLSGYEHLISHLLDLMAETQGRPLAQHGSQVALATRLTTGAYQVFLDSFQPTELNVDRCFPAAAEMRARIESRLGSLDADGRAAAECWADYRLKLEMWHANRPRVEAMLADWPAVRERLRALVQPHDRVTEILYQVGGPQNFEALVPPVTDNQARFAFENAALIRRRLTLADLFVFFNWDMGMLWEQVQYPAHHTERQL